VVVCWCMYRWFEQGLRWDGRIVRLCQADAFWDVRFGGLYRWR
jgi:hypothetical protein